MSLHSTVKSRGVLHLVSIRIREDLAAVVVILEGDTVSERANCSVLTFPVETN